MKIFFFFFFFAFVMFASLASHANEVDVCFTPGMLCNDIIVDVINDADIEVLVQAYSFTRNDVADALIAAHKRSIPVLVIIDKSRISEVKSQYQRLLDAGINVVVDTTTGIAHNKVIVTDRKNVITGSYNFSDAAQTRNAENLLVIRNERIAKKYIKYWFGRYLTIVTREKKRKKVSPKSSSIVTRSSTESTDPFEKKANDEVVR